jgi:tRNA-dihydrouridine synthase B
MPTAPPFAPDRPWLAPLAGYSDLPFRLLCREQGAACAVTEMVSAKGMVYHSPGTDALLDTCNADAPLVVQLFGAEASFLGKAMDALLERGFAWFDLNAGCSVPKVVKTGAGAALLRENEDVDRLCALARTMAERAGPGRVGVKLRLGWRADRPTYLEAARRLEQAGVGWLALHPRCGAQGFTGVADWDALVALRRAVSVPVLASGDLFTAEDAAVCLERTGVHGVMFARGALRDPTVFARLRALLAGEPEPARTPQALIGCIRRHAELSRRHGNPHVALLKMRTFVPRYVKHLSGARALRKQLASCTTWETLDELLERYLLHDSQE